jgi:hypothetical protein
MSANNLSLLHSLADQKIHADKVPVERLKSRIIKAR